MSRELPSKAQATVLNHTDGEGKATRQKGSGSRTLGHHGSPELPMWVGQANSSLKLWLSRL